MKSNLHIASAYKGIANYIKEVKSSKTPDFKYLWIKNVIEPYWNEWAAGQFNEKRVREEMNEPIIEIEKLERALDILNKSNIDKILTDTYTKINQILPSAVTERTVCIYINTNYDESVHGVVGGCVGDNILIRINPLIEGWNKYIPWVLAHEYNHCVWGYNYFYVRGNTSVDFLTSIIVEGMADSFGKIICPDASPKWIRNLTLEEEAVQWEIMKEYLLDEDRQDLYIRFFFGDSKTNTPQFTGYTIGYNIVQSFLKNHLDINISKLMDIDAHQILNGSKYSGAKL